MTFRTHPIRLISSQVFLGKSLGFMLRSNDLRRRVSPDELVEVGQVGDGDGGAVHALGRAAAVGRDREVHLLGKDLAVKRVKLDR